MNKPTNIKCVCGHDRFSGTRAIATVQLADGGLDRSWRSSLEDATEIVCGRCHRTYQWDRKTNTYVAVA